MVDCVPRPQFWTNYWEQRPDSQSNGVAEHIVVIGFDEADQSFRVLGRLGRLSNLRLVGSVHSVALWQCDVGFLPSGWWGGKFVIGLAFWLLELRSIAAYSSMSSFLTEAALGQGGAEISRQTFSSAGLAGVRLFADSSFPSLLAIDAPSC
jgi:hypothetical protein